MSVSPIAPSWPLGPFTKQVEPVLSPTAESVFDCPIEGRPVRFEAQNVYNPAAVVRDGRVYLVYRADDGPKPTPWGRTCRLGLAWSDDGRRFERFGRPVLYPDHDACEPFEWEGGCEDLHIVEDEAGTYYLNYTAWNGHRDALLVATSTDLVHWTKRGPAFARYAPERIAGTRSGVVISRWEGDRLIATRIGGRYVMLVSFNCELAVSDNLIDWQPTGQAVFGGPQPSRFDGAAHEAGACALISPAGVIVAYNAQNAGDPSLPAECWSLGQALLDPGDPSRILATEPRPFLAPELPWELQGFTPPAVVANTLIRFNNEWLLYYGGADRHIGLAVGGG